MTSDAPDGGVMPHAVAPLAVVAAHGDLAAGLVSAVGQITGRAELLVPLSNRDLAPVDIEGRLRELADGHVVALFTDLPAGSCTMAARRLLRDRPDLVLVTGVNLPALVDFVCRADAAHAAGGDLAGVAREVAQHAADRGRTALAVVAAPAVPAATVTSAPAAAAPHAP
jgi:PTS system N-acetylgalactosamine-specific IIA component